MLAQPTHLVDLIDVDACRWVWVKQHVNHFYTVFRQFVDDFFVEMITTSFLIAYQLRSVFIIEWHDSVEHNEENDTKWPDVALWWIVSDSTADFWWRVSCRGEKLISEVEKSFKICLPADPQNVSDMIFSSLSFTHFRQNPKSAILMFMCFDMRIFSHFKSRWA